MSKRNQYILVFLFLYAFRLGFGFSQPFFSTDERQTYLIGLKSYTENQWPYFGPDIYWADKNFESQMPGALEGLLIGLPLRALPIPEAPFLLLNLLTLSSLAFLCWYIHKRVPSISFPFILAWTSLLPWNLHESTNIINPSYLAIGSSFFFVGFLESLPGLSLGWISAPSGFALMGFGLFWNMQFHFSWILLVPFLALAVLWRVWTKELRIFPELVGFLGGSAFPLAFLLPTLLKFGFHQGAGGMGMAVWFNKDNFLGFFTVLARYYSLASYEMPRFLGAGFHDRIQFLVESPWLILPGFFLWLTGLVQAALLGLGGFFIPNKKKEGPWINALTFGGFLFTWIAFWFNAKGAPAVSYYILLPLIVIYSFYVYDWLASRKAWRVFGTVCLAASLLFELGYAVKLMPRQSLYTDRPIVANAINQKNYQRLGERRLGSQN
jgi:hypothetical protein